LSLGTLAPTLTLTYCSVEDEYLEESVHEEDAVRLDGGRVQEHRLWWPVERVRVQNGLDHYQGLCEVLTVQHRP
jgi:hypothetical protein